MSLNDYPKMHLADDDLGFESVARGIVDTLHSLDKSNGCVVGITGPWGSGKTTILHFIGEMLEAECSTVVWFNPWQFNKSDDLMQRLFETLRATLGRDPKFRAWAQKLARFADVIEPVNNAPIVSGGARFITGAMRSPKVVQDWSIGDVNRQRDDLEAFLRTQERDIFVFIDDLDRLPSSEVMEILKLVRLTASFPRFTYVLAFDENNVANAIQKSGEYLSGHDFLQKIIFATFRVPAMNDEIGMGFLVDQVNQMLEKYPVSQLDQQRTLRILRDFVLPLCENRRNVKRLMGSIGPVLSALSKEIEPSDLIALETIRILRPEIFELILKESRYLAWSDDDQFPFNNSRKDRAKAAIAGIASRTEALEAGLIWGDLFPHSWSTNDERFSIPISLAEALRKGRVTNRHVLERYLSRFEDHAIKAQRSSIDLLNASEDLNTARSWVTNQTEEHLLDVVEILRTIPGDQIQPKIKSLSISLFSYPTINKRRPTRFIDAGLYQSTENLLAMVISSADPQLRHSILREVMDAVPSISAKRYVAGVSEHVDGSGRAILTKEEQNRITNQYIDFLVSASTSELANERSLAYLAGQAIEWNSERRDEIVRVFENHELWRPLVASSVEVDISRRDEGRVVDMEAMNKIFSDPKKTQEVIFDVLQDDQTDVETQIAIGNTIQVLRSQD